MHRKHAGFVNTSLLCRVIACVVSVVLAVSVASIVAYANASEDTTDTTTTTTTTSVEDASDESGSEESSDTEDTSDAEESSNTGDTADADDTVDVGDSSEAVTEQTDELSGSGLQSDSDTTDSDESLSASTLSSETSLLNTTSNVDYIDAGGQKVTRQSATVVTDSSTTWSSTDTNGWYVVSGTVTISDRITVSGNVHLILADNAKLVASEGITVNENEGTLTIYAQSTDETTMGELEATSGSIFYAGIGGTSGNANGAITINGGTVSASADSVNGYGAGIGGGSWSDGHDITINGGTVTATGGNAAAGIGGGDTWGDGYNITINGGTVYAVGCVSGAGIGGGNGGDGYNIKITGGTVTAKATNNSGAGIGGGFYGDGHDITISGGTVYAEGYTGAAGIGGGREGNGYDITISGGTVTAVGGDGAAGIGSGMDGSDSRGIVISGGSVKVQSTSGASGNGAVSVTPTGEDGYSVYCLEISGMTGIDEVLIDGATYARSGGHPDGDESFYLWVLGESHIVEANGVTYRATWDDDLKSFTLTLVPAVGDDVGDDVVIDADDDSEDTEEGDEGNTSDATDTDDVVADASTSDGVSTGGVLAQTGVGLLSLVIVTVVCVAAAIVLHVVAVRKHGTHY